MTAYVPKCPGCQTPYYIMCATANPVCPDCRPYMQLALVWKDSRKEPGYGR